MSKNRLKGQRSHVEPPQCTISASRKTKWLTTSVCNHFNNLLYKFLVTILLISASTHDIEHWRGKCEQNVHGKHESRDSLVSTQVQSHALMHRGFGTSVPFINERHLAVHVIVLLCWLESVTVSWLSHTCHAHSVLFLLMQSSITGLVQLTFSFPRWFHTIQFYCSHTFHSFLSQITLFGGKAWSHRLTSTAALHCKYTFVGGILTANGQ